MPYYPKSQIKTNLYSNNEFALITNNQLYKGFYWKNSSGKFFTGKTPQDTPNIELIPISDNFTQTDDIELSPSLDTQQYNESLGNNLQFQGNIPQYSPNLPTNQDYQIGEFRRYFCKKTNELIYIEIDENTYNLLISKDPSILWTLYTPFNLPWSLTGEKQQVAITNRDMVLLTQFRLKLVGFETYLKKDYLKYYKV
jgi:hypothetical protein